MPQSLQSFKAELFKALSHPARIRILELLRDGEKSVTEMQLAMSAEGSTVSQQLAILRMKNLVDTRRVGNVIFYRLRDRQATKLLDVARQIFEAHVIQLRSMTERQDETARAAARSR
jgi:DNA-binding transcriptional ArsR family regulator